MRANDDLGDNVHMDSVQSFDIHTPDGIPIRKLFIDDIAKRTAYTDLKMVFSKYGNVEDCNLKRRKNGNKYAFITFRDPNDALKARQDGSRNKIRLHHRNLRVFSAHSLHQPDGAYKLLQEEKDGSLISRLNDDCLMHIFQFLPIRDRIRTERVCKRWRTVILNSWHTFRSLDISDDVDAYADEGSLRNLLVRCGRFLINISLCLNRCKMSRSTLTTVTELCPNIQKMDISGMNQITSSEIAFLARTFSNLTELKLEVHTYSCDDELKELFQNNLKLKKLQISNSMISGTCFNSLPGTIEELTLYACNVLFSNFFDAIRRLDKLRTLKIKGCGGGMRNRDLKVLSECQQISTLVLSGDFPRADEYEINNIARMVNLKELSVISIHLATDMFLSDLVAHCVNITRLDISYCKKVTEEGVSKLFSMPNLQHLNMRLLSIKYFNIDKSNVPLKLKTLDCADTYELDEKSICDLIESAPCLELLDLCGCIKMTNKVVEVATRCTKMRTNEILLKMRVEDTGISSFTEGSPFLYILD